MHIHIHTYIYIDCVRTEYLYIHICMYLHIYIYTLLFERGGFHTHTNIHTRANACAHTCTHTHMHTHAHTAHVVVCERGDAQSSDKDLTNIYIYICTCGYVNMNTCIELHAVV